MEKPSRPLLLVAPILVLLYALSPGPVVLLVKDPAMLPVLEKVYAPLTFLYAHVPWLQPIVDWYMRHWL